VKEPGNTKATRATRATKGITKTFEVLGLEALGLEVLRS
jgi:hypothetical protein